MARGSGSWETTAATVAAIFFALVGVGLVGISVLMVVGYGVSNSHDLGLLLGLSSR